MTAKRFVAARLMAILAAAPLTAAAAAQTPPKTVDQSGSKLGRVRTWQAYERDRELTRGHPELMDNTTPVFCPPGKPGSVRSYSPGAPPGTICGPPKAPAEFTKLPPLPRAQGGATSNGSGGSMGGGGQTGGAGGGAGAGGSEGGGGSAPGRAPSPNNGKSAAGCVQATQNGETVTFTNTCQVKVFVTWCGELKYSKDRCGAWSGKSFYNRNNTLPPGGSAFTTVIGSYRYAACEGGGGLMSDLIRDNPDGSYTCLDLNKPRAER